MSLQITRLIVNNDGFWALEIENTSGGTLNLADFSIGWSTTALTGSATRPLTGFNNAPATMAAGQKLVVGSANVAEADLRDQPFAPLGFVDSYDLFFVSQTSPFALLDSIGDGNDTTPPQWSAGNIYTADALRVPDTVSSDDFDLTEDFTASAYCFAAGTLIATPRGAVEVETLSIGDLVTTADGRAVPVIWLGRQTLAPHFAPLRLIRVAAGALGAGVPARDLTLTSDHALMIGGLLVNAGALVNGATVIEVAPTDLPERVTVYHVETENHDVCLAEGTPSETFIDYAGRSTFDNYAEYVALYGEDRSIAENPRPRVTSARQLPASLRQRLGMTQAA